MSGLPREVLKWVQSLDLTWKLKTPKWDLTNGYLVAEIFSWYFPQEIEMFSFYNCNSLVVKQKNWYLLQTFIKSRRLKIPDEYVEGTIHCKEGAAALLLECIYELLTHRKVAKMEPEMPVDYTDYAYQVKLPLHARSTAAKAIKNNVQNTEVMADPCHILNAQKCQKIISNHIDHRRLERASDPVRFGIKPSVGEQCLRKPVPVKNLGEGKEEDKQDKDGESHGQPKAAKKEQSDMSSSALTREPSVHFKEIQVQQMDKSALYSMPIYGF